MRFSHDGQTLNSVSFILLTLFHKMLYYLCYFLLNLLILVIRKVFVASVLVVDETITLDLVIYPKMSED